MTTFNPYTLDKIERAMQSPRRHSLGRGKVDAKSDPIDKAARAAGGFARGVMKGAGESASPAARSARVKGTLARMVAKTPEVTVKVTGRQNGAGHTLVNFSYISRLGWGDGKEIPLETSDGQTLTNGRQMQELAREWHEWETADQQTRRKGSTSLSMVLSMPSGTDPDKLKAAALDFAHDEMANRSWVLALHNDTDHVHCHLTIARRDDDGRRFNPNREDLARYREIFAEKLRDRGIEANATPRHARGVTKTTTHRAVLAIRARGETPQVDAKLKEGVIDRYRAGQTRSEYDDRAAAGRGKILEAYKAVSMELLSGDSDDKKLAMGLAQFASKMPPPLSRDSRIIAEMQKAEQQQARTLQERQPTPPAPTQKGPDKSGPER